MGRALSLLLILAACSTDVSVSQNARCDGIVQPAEDTVDSLFDKDEDGYVDGSNADCQENYPPDQLDCDDGNPAVNPGAAEIGCNGIDEDCDPATIDAEDLDGDGSNSCEDCDDTDPDNFPGNPEVCDGLDNDCNGLADGGNPGVGGSELDGDGDGVSICEGDCNDADPDNVPGGIEVCDGKDNDCNGLDDAGDPGVAGAETDDDGDGISECAGDCDDGDPASFPGNLEVCDGLDNDCDGGTTAPGGELDADGDGYVPCDNWVGAAPTLGGDCDDTDLAVNPGAIEICNGVDDDCSGAIDDAVGANANDWYPDADGDGFGDDLGLVEACDAPPDHTDVGGDCNDGNDTVYPGAPELCDGLDNDCNGPIDDGTSSIGGMLFVDTVLDLAGSPWCLSEDVDVGPGVSLTVEADVVVDGRGYAITNYGTVAVTGLPGQHAHLYDTRLLPGANSPGQDYLFDLDHLWMHGGVLYPATGNAVYGTLWLTDSVLENPTGYVYLWYPTSTALFERNVFIGLPQISTGTDGPAVDIRNNVFVDWSGAAIENWAAYNNAQVTVTGNSFLSPGTAVSLPGGYNSAAMSAVGNWWGTTDPMVIETMIYDQNDDFSSAGFIDFQPYLYGPDPGTPDPAPYLP